MPAPLSWHVRGRVLALDRPLVMGVVNVTPDSFSDGGRYVSVESALQHARRLVKEGADILDIGGESTRPQGARPVSLEEELERVIPVIRAVAADNPNVTLSIDTVKSQVAEEALSAGVHIVNDVSALRLDPMMAGIVARQCAGLILMHSRGDVANMATYVHADYPGDVLEEVEKELQARIHVAHAAGVVAECIVVDPGIGFSKRAEASLRLLAGIGRMARWGYPIVVGASRKRFIGRITRVDDAAARMYGSVGAAVSSYERGASIFRVHDVAATRQALDVAAAIRRASVQGE